MGRFIYFIAMPDCCTAASKWILVDHVDGTGMLDTYSHINAVLYCSTSGGFCKRAAWIIGIVVLRAKTMAHILKPGVRLIVIKYKTNVNELVQIEQHIIHNCIMIVLILITIFWDRGVLIQCVL